MALVRSFTRQELDALGLPGALPKDRVLLNEITTTTRWSEVWRLVFRAPDDEQAYEIYYERPSTEYQEGLDPWNDEATVEATLVEQRTIFRSEWRPAGSPVQKDEAHTDLDGLIRQGLKCAVCHGSIDYVDAPTGGWWAHRTHPKDGHDAVSLLWGTDPVPWAHREEV